MMLLALVAAALLVPGWSVSAQKISGASPTSLQLTAGGPSAKVSITGSYFDNLASVQVLHNYRPTSTVSGQLTCSSAKCVITLMAAANAAPGKGYSFLLLDTKKNQFKTGVAIEVVSGTPPFTPKTINNVSLGVTIADQAPAPFTPKTINNVNLGVTIASP